MAQLLGFVIISFFLTSFLLIPFIDFLFYLKHRKKINQKENDNAHNIDTPIHNQLLKGKDIDTPVGGGILLIVVMVLLNLGYAYFYRLRNPDEFYLLLMTILSFGFIGLLDDIRKIFLTFSGKYAGVKIRYILLLQTIFAFAISVILYQVIGLNNIFIPVLGNIVLGWWYIPLAVLVIVAFSNAFNISDGLDGLSSGLLLICLFAFLVLAHTVFDKTLGTFVGFWIGALIAYLYFNVFPARIYLGDAGAFGFGATLAVVGLLTGKIIGLGVIGGVYVIIVGSSLLQILSKKVFKKKLFPVAPLHMYFKYLGWEEPKIVMRFWLVGAIFAVFGLWLSLLSK